MPKKKIDDEWEVVPEGEWEVVPESEFLSPRDTSQDALMANPPRRKLAGLAQEYIPMVGGIIGSLLTGTKATPTGAGGAAVGGMAGQGYADIIGTMLGYPRALESAADNFKHLGTVGATSAVGELGGRGLFAGAKKALAPMAASFAKPEAQEVASIAKKKGMDLLPSDITQDRFLGGVESGLNYTPGGNFVMSKFRSKQYDDFQNLLGSHNPQVNATSAGQTIQEGMARANDVATKKANVLYDAVGKMITPETPIPTKNLKDAAQKLLGKQTAAGPAWQNSNIMARLRDLVGDTRGPARGANYYGEFSTDIAPTQKPLMNTWEKVNSIKETLNGIIGDSGKGMYSSQEVGQARFLRRALEQDLDSYATATGGDFKAAYDIANSMYSKNKALFNRPSVKRLMSANPEQVVGLVRDATDAARLKAVVGTRQYKVFQDAYLTKTLFTPANATGKISPTSVFTNFNKNREMLQKVLPPKEFQAIEEVAKLGGALGTAEKIAGNASGTARGVLFGTGIGMGLFNPKIAVGYVIAPAGIAKLYTSPVGRRLLTQGYKLPPGSKEAARVAGQIAAFVGKENLEAEDSMPSGYNWEQ